MFDYRILQSKNLQYYRGIGQEVQHLGPQAFMDEPEVTRSSAISTELPRGWR